MAQEFTINSSAIETKINQLLPSQGGFGAGIDFSASTMVIPIVDLTETAEGSGLREDLQTALSHNTANVFDVENATTTVINTTGYWRIIGTVCTITDGSNEPKASFIINDGSTDKTVYALQSYQNSTFMVFNQNYDFNVFLSAGDSLIIKSNNNNTKLLGSVRQLADISGNLINP